VRFVKNQLIKLFRQFGVYPSPLINSTQFGEIIKFLIPIKNGHELIRVGNDADGGYLIPNDLKNISWCISPGVENKMEFEAELWNRFKIKSIMFDGSVNSPTNMSDGQKFYKLFVGAATFENFVSMNDIIVNYDLDKEEDLVGQIDIESAEYSFLNATSDKNFNRFRILVVEFHEIDRWIQKKYYSEVIEPMLIRLNRLFDLVHLHPNNNGGFFSYKRKTLPNVVEITFHRKDRAKGYFGNATLPHPLDSKNIPWKSDLTF